MDIRFECCQHCIGHRNDALRYNQHVSPCSEGCNGEIEWDDSEDRTDGTA